MAKPDITEKFIASKFIELTEINSPDSITVQRLAKECDLNRKSFYYHFETKADLICYIFESNLQEFMDGPDSIGNIQDIALYMYQEVLLKNFQV